MPDATDRLIALARAGVPVEQARAAVVRASCGTTSLAHELVAKLRARHLAEGQDEATALEGALHLNAFAVGLGLDVAARHQPHGVPAHVSLSLARSRVWHLLQVPRHDLADLAEDSDRPTPAPVPAASQPGPPVRLPHVRRRHSRGPQT